MAFITTPSQLLTRLGPEAAEIARSRGVAPPALSRLVRGDLDDMVPSALEVLFEMQTALCLVNRRWCTHDYYAGLADTFAFPRLPEGYPELVPQLYRARRPEEILALADELVANYKRFLAETGIQVRDFARVSEIPV